MSYDGVPVDRFSSTGRDANGNTLSDGMNTYVWDARNRLVSADSNGAGFSYDPLPGFPAIGLRRWSELGRRVAKTVMTTTTSFVYDGVNAVEEFGTNPTANLLTGGVDERFLRTSATETDNYLTDALGSTVALTDATGATQVQYSYSPYGSQSATGSTTNSYTYTGREFDGLGINYYRARYYNPTTGRFLSEDPSGFRGGINLYAYAGNNPMSFNDPFGLKPHGWGSVAAAAAAAAAWTWAAAWAAAAAAEAPEAAADAEAAAADAEAAAEPIGAEGPAQGPYSSYNNTTDPGAQVPNITTNASASDAVNTLQSNGYAATTSADGQATILTDADGDQYVVRPSNTAPSGVAADYYPAGSSQSILKINF